MVKNKASPKVKSKSGSKIKSDTGTKGVGHLPFNTPVRGRLPMTMYEASLTGKRVTAMEGFVSI